MNFLKKFFCFSITVLTVLNLFSCANKTTEPPITNQVATQKLPDKDIVILCTNDVHCAIDKNIGYAGLLEYYNKVSSGDNYTFLVDGGDFTQGSVYGSIGEGKYMCDIINELPYDFIVPGNHEFDYGLNVFDKNVDLLNKPLYACNYLNADTLEPIFASYKIMDAGNVKIAFIGALTPETLLSASLKTFQDENGKNIAVFSKDGTMNGIYESIQENVDEVKSKGADYVILVDHFGDTSDTYNVFDLVKNTNGIDYVIDAHSHSVLDGVPATNKDGKTIYITQTGTELVNIGEITIKKDGTITHKLVDKVEKFSPDAVIAENGNARNATMEKFINDIKYMVDKDLQNVVIKDNNYKITISDIETGKRAVRTFETNMGDLCADAMRYVCEADVGVMPAGMIRADFEVGDITDGDIIKVLPAGRESILLSVKGSELRDFLEYSFKDYGIKENAVLSPVSGMTFTVDNNISSPVKIDEKGTFIGIDGDRKISDIMINEAPLDDNKYYKLASYSFFMEDPSVKKIFNSAEKIDTLAMTDFVILKTYLTIKKDLSEYKDPKGNGRVIIK